MESKLTHTFLKEQLDHQNKYIKVVDKYLPDVRAVPITPKFYSKYEQVVLKDDEKTRKCVKLIEDVIKNGPKDIYPEPLLESHCYGWIPGPFAKYDERDMRLLFRPQVKSDITRVGELIEHEKITARPYYTGVPFRVVF